MTSGKHLKGSVLVLDDDPWHVAWIEDLAEIHGLSCEIVSTLDEATAAFVRMSPDVAVVDIRIGDVDAPLQGATLQSNDPKWVGLRFVHFIRVEQKRPASAVTVFVYTGHDREELQRVVENAYSARFFTKFDGSAFRSTLDAEFARVSKKS